MGKHEDDARSAREFPPHYRSTFPCKVKYTDPATFAVTASDLDEMREQAQEIDDWDSHSGASLIIKILDRIKGGTNGNARKS